MVNSQGEPAKGFTLGDIENTDKVLTFGTRAASVNANGFYRVPVIASDPQNDGVEFDKGALAAAAKNVLNELKNPKENDLDLSKIASALYKNLPELTAYTVKAKYYLYNPDTKTLKLEKIENHVTDGDYDIAAVAVKPVSFNFLKDNATLDKLSGWAVENFQLPSLSSKLNKVIDAIKVEKMTVNNSTVNVVSILAANDVKNVEVKDGNLVFTNASNNVVATIKVDADTKVEHVGTIGNQELYKITSTIDPITTVLDEVVDNVNGQLQPIKDVLSKTGSKWENVIAKVNPLLQKVSSKIGSVNKFLQPTILYVDKNGNPNTLSTIGGRLATRFVGTGATTLYATSWTAELLAPAYKKSISVLEKGATVTLTNGKSAAEPFDGSINKVIFNAENAGTYTIVYKAIDYSGVEVEKTFKVNVVE